MLGFIKRHTVQCPYKPTVRIGSQLFYGFWFNRLRTGRHFVISTEYSSALDTSPAECMHYFRSKYYISGLKNSINHVKYKAT